MPIYDVACAACSYEGTCSITFDELAAWDQSALCPSCGKGDAALRRQIKRAPARGGQASSATGRAGNRMPGAARPMSAGDRDDMRHSESKRRNPDQIAAAVEAVKKGTFEGF